MYLTVIGTSPSQQIRSTPVWFGPTDAPLFGLVDVPEAQARGAIVICPPFGREYVNVYSTFSQLATCLKLLGFVVLRFDYRSTGDSFDRTVGQLRRGWIRRRRPICRRLRKRVGRC